MNNRRVEALVDGTFAIVITLLVLEVAVPPVEGHKAGTLAAEVGHLLPKILSFVISVLIAGIYWIGHHGMFYLVRRVDRSLLWLNVLFLLFVAFIPFSSGLLGEYGLAQQNINEADSRFALIFYGSNLILCGLSLCAVWLYATAGRRMVDAELPSRAVRAVVRKCLQAPVIYLLAILAAFIPNGLWLSASLYCFVPILYIIPDRVDRQLRPQDNDHPLGIETHDHDLLPNVDRSAASKGLKIGRSHVAAPY